VEHRGDLDREGERLLFQVVRAVADATHAGDPYMAGHSTRVAAYCEKLADSLGLPPRERLLLFLAAAFHDIGYLATPTYILRKPSVLAEDEMEEVRVHPLRGAEVFAAEPALGELARAIRHHHERFDGSGYPDGLRGEDIPFFSRIILVAETYEAMTHHRPYRRALAPEEAQRRLRESAGSQLDPEIVKHFLAILGSEPGL
jgi:HD-GYP domain-containing protein (c-di-GMP phosphodiesterase class II)